MAETVATRANPLAPLTDAEIRALPQPDAGRLVLRDPACRGLELRLAAPSSRNPAGTRTWPDAQKGPRPQTRPFKVEAAGRPVRIRWVGPGEERPHR